MSRERFFYGWLVLAAAVIIVSIVLSMRYSFSVFYKTILNEFGWSRAETAAAFSVSMLTYGMSSPLVGTLVDKIGPKRVLFFGTGLLSLGLLGMSLMNSIWLFYILFGVVMAIGINSSGYAVHNSYLPNWFQEKRGLAFGILAMSSGAASVIASQYQRLILLLGWRISYRVMALIAVSIITPLTIFFVKKTPSEVGLLPYGVETTGVEGNPKPANQRRSSSLVVDREWTEKDWTLPMAVKTRRFWLVFLSLMGVSITLNMNTAHQVVYTQDIGFNPVFAASVLGLVGLFTMSGNFLSSFSDWLGREITLTIGTAGTVVAIISLMQARISQPWLLYAYAVTWGIFFGTGSPSLVSGLADMFSGHHFGAINGSCMLGWGLGGAIGPWLGGYIYDLSGTYRLAFLIMATSMALACVSFWLAAPRKVRRARGRALRESGKS